MHSSCRTVSRLLVLLLAPAGFGACTQVGSQAPLPRPAPVERGAAPTSGTTPEAARIMLEVLSESGSDAGIKPSGEIRDVETAGRYLALADEIMGDDWVSADKFRFGASGVLTTLIAVLDGEETVTASDSGY